MKNPRNFWVWYSVSLFSILFVSGHALQLQHELQLRDAQTWDELKKTDSDTINAASEKCEAIIAEAKNNYQILIENLLQYVSQQTEFSSIKSKIRNTIDETTRIMQECSRKVDEEFGDLGKTYLNRLEIVINVSKGTASDIAVELEKVYDSEIQDTDQLVTLIRQFVANDYDPITSVKPIMYKSLYYNADNADEFQKTVKKETDLFFVKMNTEIDRIENIVIRVLNRISKAMTVMKVVYASLKRNKQLPLQWDPQYIIQVLYEGTIMSKTTIQDETEIQQPQSGQELSSFKEDEIHSSEENIDEETEDDDLGCVLIFNRTKRKLLKQLIITVTEIKTFDSIKQIDDSSRKMVSDYESVFQDLHFQIESKIVDYIHTFVKLYKIHMNIMDIINPAMKLKMLEIFQDTTVDYNNSFYAEIQRFLTASYMSRAKTEQLCEQIENSARGAKTLREIQKKISKELVFVTTALGKDLEDMKMVIVYILEEMREGVVSLKNLKENSNVTGYRWFFNNFDGTDDLRQLKKLITILNMMDINRMLRLEVMEIMASNEMNVSRSITNALVDEINRDEQRFDLKIDEKTDIDGIKRTLMIFVDDFHKMVHNYIYKTRKSFKHILTLFVTVYEELMILLSRKEIQNVEEIENIGHSGETSTEIGLISNYLAENASIQIEKQYGGNFSFDTSSNFSQLKVSIKEQLHSMTQTMISELTQLDLQIENITDKIINVTKNIERVGKELTEKRSNYIVPLDDFQDLGLILTLSNTLNVLSAQNDIPKSHNQEIYQTMNNAMEYIQTAKAKAQEAIQESKQIDEVKTHMKEIKTNVRAILLDVGSEVKENIDEMCTNFANAFDSFITASENQQIRDQIENANVEPLILSQPLEEMLTNCYANKVVDTFGQCLSQSGRDISTEESKDIVLTSLNETVQTIEQDMEAVKVEVTINIVDNIAQGIELIEHLQNKRTSTIDEEQVGILCTASNLVNVLKGYFSTDSTYNEKEMQTMVNSARQFIGQEYTRVINHIRGLNDEGDIQNEASNSIQTISDIYSDLNTNIKNQLEGYGSTFIENYESVMSNILGNNEKLEFVMQDLMNGQATTTENSRLQGSTSFMRSEAFTFPEWIKAHFEMSRQSTTNQFNSINEAIAHQLSNTYDEIETNFVKMEETIVFMTQELKQSSAIIHSIENDMEKQLSSSEITTLGNSFQLIQTLRQPTVNPNSNRGFEDAKKLIVEEYRGTMKQIESLQDNTVIRQEIIKVVESYTSTYEDLRVTIEETLSQQTSSFLILYNSVEETAKFINNSPIENVLKDIKNTNEETMQFSESYREIESYIKSEKLQSSLVIQSLFDNQQPSTEIERLEVLTADTQQCIDEMEKVSISIGTLYQRGNDILKIIESSEITELSNEQIATLTEAIHLTRSLSTTDNSEISNMVDTRSLEQTIKVNAMAISETQTNILSVFDEATYEIETTTEESSIEQIINSTIKQFDTIFNDTRDKLKADRIDNCENYINYFRNIKSNIGSNGQLETILQQIEADNQFTATFLDEDSSKILTYLTTDSSQPLNVASTTYENIHREANTQQNVQERSLEELNLTTTELCQKVVEIEFSENYIQQKFQQGLQILGKIESGETTILDEKNEKILAINAQIIQTLQTTQVKSNEVNFIMETQNAINDEIQSTINTIQSITDEAEIVEVITPVVQNVETMFNNLKAEFKVKVEEKMAEYKENFESTIEFCQEQGNSQLETILKDTSTENLATESRPTLTQVQTYMASTSYVSSTTITDMYKTLREKYPSKENVNENNTNILQMMEENINENIYSMEITSKNLEETFQQSSQIFESIRNGEIKEMTTEQIDTISLSNQFEQILVSNANGEHSVTEKDFIETEVAIKEEFEQTIKDLESISEETVISEKITTTIQKTDVIFNTLKEKVQEEINFTTTTFEEIVTTYELTSENQSNIQLVQVNEKLRQEEWIQENNELLQQVKSYIEGDIYNSASPVQTMFDSIQTNTELNINEQNITKMKSLDKQVNNNIKEMSEIRRIIVQNFEQGTEIIKQIPNTTENLTEEQVQILTTCHDLSKIIISKEVTITTTENTQISNNEFREYEEAKQTITEVYENTMKKIESLVDDAAITQVVSESINTEERVYNYLKKEIKSKIVESTTEFEHNFESTVQAIEENGYVEKANVLRNIETNELNTNELFTKYEPYINSDSYNSETFVENTYEEVQSSGQFNDNMQKPQIEAFKLLNNQLNEDIELLNEMSTYTVETVTSGIEILEIFQDNSTVDLTDEQTNVLAVCNKITRTFATEEESTFWNILDVWSNDASTDTSKVDTVEIKESIKEEYSKTVEIIRTLKSEEEIKEVMLQNVENCASIYNNLQENIQNKMTNSGKTFLEKYDSATNIIREGQNLSLQNLIQNIETDENKLGITPEYQQFESLIASSVYSSTTVIKETFDEIKIENNYNPADSNNSITEMSIAQLEIFTTKTEEYIDTMNNANNYVGDTLEKADEVLNQIEKNENIELTQNEVQLLSLGHKISSNLSRNRNEAVISSVTETENTSQIQLEIDVKSTMAILNEELTTLVQTIESATDEDTVQQVVTNCVQKYEEAYTNLKSDMQTRMTNVATDFDNNYCKTLDKIQQSGNNNVAQILSNINTTQQVKEENDYLIQFETFVESDNYKSTHPVADIYKNVKQEDTISSLSSFNERGVEELKLLNLHLTEEIGVIQTTTSYIESSLQSGQEILNTIQSNNETELSEEQVENLTICQKIVQTISTVTTEIVNTEITISPENEDITISNEIEIQETGINSETATNLIEKEYEKSINIIRSTNEKEVIQKTVTDFVQNYDTINNNMKQTVQIEIQEKFQQFNESYQLLTNTNEEINNQLKDTQQNISNNQRNSSKNEYLMQFNQFIQSENFQSSTLANNIYSEMQQNEGQFFQNENIRSEEELTLLTTKIKENINTMVQIREYVAQNLDEGLKILETIRQTSDNVFVEEDIQELLVCNEIVSTLSTYFSETTITKSSVATLSIDSIRSQSQDAINEINTLNDENSIRQVIENTVQHYDEMLIEEQQIVEKKINDSKSAFEETYQSTISVLQESENEQFKRITEGQENFVPDENYSKFKQYFTNGGYKSIESATNISERVENDEKSLPANYNINEKYSKELTEISTRVTENMNEIEEMTSYVTTSLDKGAAVLDILKTDENVELTEQQIQEVTLGQSIMQVLSIVTVEQTVVEIETLIPKQTEVSIFEETEKLGNLIPEEIENPIPEETKNLMPEIDFADIQITMDKKLDEFVQKINSITDEETVIEMVNESVQESSTTYSTLQQSMQNKIDETSSTFGQNFETAISSLPENSPLSDTLNEISNHNIQLSSNNEEEYQRVLSQITDEEIMSSSAVENIYTTIRESDTQMTDVKERSIFEMKSLNEKVKENITTMKRIDQYVSENLQTGLTILQDTVREQVQELNEEQIQSLAISTVISQNLSTQTESSVWSTFVSYASEIMTSEDETTVEEATIQNNQDSTLQPQSNVIEGQETENIEHSTRSLVQLGNIFQNYFDFGEENAAVSNCITANGVMSRTEKIKNSGLIFINDLLVNWSLTEHTNTQFPSICQHVSLAMDQYNEEDEKKNEIMEYVIKAREIITKSLQYQESRINLYQNPADILVIFVNAIEIIDEVLGELSSVITENLSQILASLFQQIDIDIRQKLEQVTGTLNEEFLNNSKIFFSLMAYEGTNLRNLIDINFTSSQCNSLSDSKNIVLEKFSILNENIEIIFMHINCTLQLAMEIIFSGKMSLESSEKNLEIIKNNQLLHNMIKEINS